MHILAGVVGGNFGAVTATVAGFPVVAEFVVQNSWSHPLHAPPMAPNYL
jgi:hypothetical protein